MAPIELPLTDTQRGLLHAALRDVHMARERLKHVKLLQRYTGQPKLTAAVVEIDGHLRRLWHLIDGLDSAKPAERPCSEA